MTDETTEPVRCCRRVGCGKEVPESLGTRPREYCSRNCRQRAYEARKVHALLQEERKAALAEAARGATSRDDGPATRPSSRDVGRMTVLPLLGNPAALWGVMPGLPAEEPGGSR